MIKSRSNIWWATAAILLMVAILALWLASSPRDYVQQGRTIKEWVGRINPQSGSEKEREAANWAIIQAGTNALPDVERILAWRRNGLVETAQRYAMRWRLLLPPKLDPLELQSRACESAYNLAERADVDISRLVPHLCYHFTNGTYADSNSGRALARAGAPGIAVLTNLLFSGSRNVRDQSAWALGTVNRKPEVSAMLIAAATSETDPMLRANTLLYLKGSQARSEQVVPLGLKYLHSENGYERWLASLLLKDYVEVPEVHAAFQLAVTDNDTRVRAIVKRALESEKKQAGKPTLERGGN